MAKMAVAATVFRRSRRLASWNYAVVSFFMVRRTFGASLCMLMGVVTILLVPLLRGVQACEIQPGDIMVTGFNAVNPDTITLVLLSDMPRGGEFYMTDQSWDAAANGGGGGFVTTNPYDGTLKVRVVLCVCFPLARVLEQERYISITRSEGKRAESKAVSCHSPNFGSCLLCFCIVTIFCVDAQWTFRSGMLAGREICFGCVQDGGSIVDWFEMISSKSSNSTFSLDVKKGETITLYCLSAEDGSVQPISAITNEIFNVTNSTSTTTVATNSTSTSNITNSTNRSNSSTTATATMSLIPDSLPNDTITVLSIDSMFHPNYQYDGDTVGTAAEIRAGLSNATFWQGRDDFIPSLQTQSSFTILDATGKSASSAEEKQGSTKIWLSVVILLAMMYC
jgi:hypothetical protein